MPKAKKIEDLSCKIGSCVERNNELALQIIYEAFKSEEDIPFKDLYNVNDPFKMPVINGWVHSEPILKEGKKACFKTTFGNGSTLVKHFHSDCSERVKNIGETIFRIELGEGESHRTVFLYPGCDLEMSPGLKHQFTSMLHAQGKDGILEVEFNKC